MADTLGTIAATRAQTRSDAEVNIMQAGISQMRSLRQIDADEQFTMERAAEEKSFAAKQAFLAVKRSQIHGDDLKAKAQADADEEAAEIGHQQKLLEIDRKAELEKKQLSIQAQQGIQTSFATMVNDMLSGTKKLSDIFRNFGVSVANIFTNLIAQKFTQKLFDASGINKAMDSMVSFITDGIGQMVGKWFGGQAAMTAATEAGTAARTAADEEASAQSIATTAMTAIKNIAAWAWQAAAAVYASVAAIPYIGAFLAPAMAIAAGVLVLGFASRIMSSEGGDAQVDEDRLNFVHKDETILPAEYASGLRDIISMGAGKKLAPSVANTLKDSIGAWRVPAELHQGAAAAAPPTTHANAAAVSAMAGKGGGGDTHNYNINVSAMDGQSVRRVLIDNKEHVAAAMNSAMRGFSKG